MDTDADARSIAIYRTVALKLGQNAEHVILLSMDVSSFTLIIPILTRRMITPKSKHQALLINAPDLLVETNLFPKLFEYLTFFHIEYPSVLSRWFLFFLKVTNFYRKSFGDDLLTDGSWWRTNGNQWLPSATVGCHRSVSPFTDGYRWENSERTHWKQ